MNIESLRIFTEVYQQRSFAAVAQQRNIAPSSVSRAIGSLEQSLSARLFQRTTRQLSPTEAGDRFYARISPIMEEFDTAREEVHKQSEQPRGTLKIAASVSFGQLVLSNLLIKFHEQFPGIRLELQFSDQPTDLIAESIDIAIRHGRLADSSLIAKRLVNVRYHVVASPEYLQQHGQVSHPNQLGDHRIISFSYENFRYRWALEKDGERLEQPISPVITATNADVIRRLTLAGSGISLLADWTIKQELESGALIDVFPDWHASGMHTDSAIWMVYPSRHYLPAKTRAFIRFLEQTIKKGG